MKGIWGKYLSVLVLALCLAPTAWGDQSKRGFYEGDLAGGGKIVFFVQGNHAISAYFFDVAGQQSGFAGGGAGGNGKFSLKTNKQLTITGTITDTTITATYLGQNITAIASRRLATRKRSQGATRRRRRARPEISRRRF